MRLGVHRKPSYPEAPLALGTSGPCRGRRFCHLGGRLPADA